MSRITETQRLTKALEMIEEISACEQSLSPQRDWKSTHDGICSIYKIVHSIRSPKCRPNHPEWCQQIDKAILEDRKKEVK